MKKYTDDVMLNNIYSQPHYFRKILNNKDSITKDFVQLFLDNDIKRIYLSGHGSTNYATIAIKYMISKLLEIDTSAHVATRFYNFEGFNSGHNPQNQLLICPAATGNTKGPVLSARKANQMGIKVVGSGIYSDGILAKECDVFMNKLTGEEVSYADVKGHSATLFLYAVAIIETAYKLNKIDKKRYDKYYEDINRLIDSHFDIFKKSEKWFEENKELLISAEISKVISYGINYSTAIEASLKISESTQRDSIGYDLEQFLHGPNMSSKFEDLIFFVNPKGKEYDRCNQTYDLMKDTGYENCILISGSENKMLDDRSFSYNFTDDFILSPIEYLVFFQVIAAKLATELGLDTTVQPERFVAVTSVLETSFK